MTSGVFANTTNYRFNLIQFDFATWHTLEYENWQALDAILGTYVGVGNVQGVWKNSTAYVVGTRVADDDNGSLYQCLIAHTSPAAPTTFTQDRSANPTRWDLLTLAPQFRGEWAASTLYNNNDFVVFTDGPIYAVANQSHTSGATFAGDSDKWDYLVDASTFPTAADRVSKTGDTMTGDLIIRPASGAGELNVDVATGQDAIVSLTEINSQFGHRFRYDGTDNALLLESTVDSFANVTVAFSNARNSAVVDFKGTPTVNGNALLTTAVGASTYLPLTGGTLTGDLTLNEATPVINVGGGSLSTGDAAVEVGAGRTGNGFSFIDLIGDTTYTDFGLRLIRRNGGPNADSQLLHRGTGPLQIVTDEAGDIQFVTNSITRATFSGSTGVFNTVSTPTINGTSLNSIYAPIAHVGSGGAAHADVVANGADGFMTGADKAKLNGIESGAQVNAVTSVNGQTGAVVVQAAPKVVRVWKTQDQDVDQSGPGTGGLDNISWDAEYDPNNIITVPGTTFVIPTGASFFMATGELRFDRAGAASSTSSIVRVVIFNNGIEIYRQERNFLDGDGGTIIDVPINPGIHVCTPGQNIIFGMRVSSESGNPDLFGGVGTFVSFSQVSLIFW